MRTNLQRKKCIRYISLWLCTVLLIACGPNTKERAALSEKSRIECLDKFCIGDVDPRNDYTDELLKFNGRWYVGPKTYFSSGRNGAAFYWPSKTPAFAGGDYPEKGQDFYDIAIEIHLGTKPTTPIARNTYQLLLQEEQQGRVTEKRNLRAGLDAWRTQGGASQETWFIATDLKDPSGDPPVISCRKTNTNHSRCTGGFTWQPEIAATMRFRADHSSDWPEIYNEISRVLNLLKKV